MSNYYFGDKIKEEEKEILDLIEKLKIRIIFENGQSFLIWEYEEVKMKCLILPDSFIFSSASPGIITGYSKESPIFEEAISTVKSLLLAIDPLANEFFE